MRLLPILIPMRNLPIKVLPSFFEVFGIVIFATIPYAEEILPSIPEIWVFAMESVQDIPGLDLARRKVKEVMARPLHWIAHQISFPGTAGFLIVRILPKSTMQLLPSRLFATAL